MHGLTPPTANSMNQRLDSFRWAETLSKLVRGCVAFCCGRIKDTKWASISRILDTGHTKSLNIRLPLCFRLTVTKLVPYIQQGKKKRVIGYCSVNAPAIHSSK